MDTLLLFAMIVFSSMLTAGLCLVGFMVLRRRVTDDQLVGAEKRSERIIDRAHRAAGSIRADAESSAASELQRRRERLEREIVERKEALEREEDRVAKIEEKVAKEQVRLERRLHEVEGREREVGRAEKEIQAAESRAAALAAEAKAKLEEVGGLTADEARQRLVEAVVDEARQEAARRVWEIEAETKEEAEKRAKRILGLAIQRYAGEYVAERTVSVVALPNDDMKGRIIGREGRNIRAFEAAAGVDLIVDDTPETVVVSCFNPVRRAIAKTALERLIEDGRIHPTRIEEVVAKVTEEIDEEIREAGERAAFDVGVHGLHPEVVKLLGRLKFRTSYTQNVLAHSCEAAHLAGIMAAELGLDAKLAKRAALLHDVGKSLDTDQEGSHAIVGAEFLRKRGETDVVVNAVAAHHAEVEQLTVYPMLVQAADALSGARPGARREVLESYIQRLEKLEEIANAFPGVTRTYAIQAGREIRVAVDSEAVGDADAALLSHEIARKIEKELTYPGQIRVTVIRETRAVDVAR